MRHHGGRTWLVRNTEGRSLVQSHLLGDGNLGSNLLSLEESMDGLPLAFRIWWWVWRVSSGFRQRAGKLYELRGTGNRRDQGPTRRIRSEAADPYRPRVGFDGSQTFLRYHLSFLPERQLQGVQEIVCERTVHQTVRLRLRRGKVRQASPHPKHRRPYRMDRLERHHPSRMDHLDSVGDLALISRRSNPDSQQVDPPPGHQEIKEILRSNPNLNGTHGNPDYSGDKRKDEIVWLPGRLCSSKVVNRKSFVLVSWYPIWEPPNEYLKEEVERVKR